MRTNFVQRILFVLLAFAAIVACTKDEPITPTPDEKPDTENPGTENPDTDDPNNDTPLLPDVVVEVVDVTDTTISFTIEPKGVDEVKWLVVESSATKPEYDTVYSEGEVADATATATYTATGLQPETEYYIAVAATASGTTMIFGQTATTLAGSGVEMPDVTVTLREGSATETSVSFFISSTEAEVLRWVCVEDGSREVTAEQVLSNGKDADVNVESEIVVTDLKEDTAYAIYAAATCNIEGFVPVLAEKLVVTTLEPEPVGYHLAEGTTASASVRASDLDNYFIIFDNKGFGYTLRADFYTAAGSEYLPSGEYTLGSAAEGALSQNFTTFMFTPTDSTMTPFANGCITVEAVPNEETREVVYAIEGLLYFDNGDFVTLKYNGTIEGIMLPEPLPEDPEMPEVPDNATLFTPDSETKTPERLHTDSLVPGEYYMKFYDKDWNELAIDLMLDPAICNDGKAPLPAGRYTMEDGTIDPYTNITIYSPYYGERFTEAELVVGVNGEEYELTFLGTAGSGSSARVFYMHYVGEITDMVIE